MEYILKSKNLICLFHRSFTKIGSAQDDGPNNYDECEYSNGICIDGGCPDNSQEIGMCDDDLFCCRR
uniref:Beta-defensin-like domain-containing protein n=1 Tax=Podarcis muralis TaxID=64176 RepID=A0A670HNH8_PODMU